MTRSVDAGAIGRVGGPCGPTSKASTFPNSVSVLEMLWSSHAGLGIRLSHLKECAHKKIQIIGFSIYYAVCPESRSKFPGLSGWCKAAVTL